MGDFGRAAIVILSRGNPRENIQRLSIGTLSQCHRILGVKMQFITHPHHQAPRKFRLLGTRFQVDQGHREPTETPRILGLLHGSQLRIPRRRGAYAGSRLSAYLPRGLILIRLFLTKSHSSFCLSRAMEATEAREAIFRKHQISPFLS